MSEDSKRFWGAVRDLAERRGFLPEERRALSSTANWEGIAEYLGEPDIEKVKAMKLPPYEPPMTDLEAYGAIEAVLEPVDPNEQVTCEKHGQSYALFSNDYCTECAEAEGWLYPYWVEGDRVTLFNKPGTVRWVLPEGKGVAVVFEDGMMYWARGEEIASIGERE